MKSIAFFRSFLVLILSFSASHLLAENPFLEKALTIDNHSFSSTLQYEDVTKSPYKELYNLIDQMNIGAKNPKFNGTILVGYEGKVLYEKAYGEADHGIGLKNSLETPTQIASITKTFTGTAVAWLQEKGFLNVSDPVQQYLWEFPYSNITIENLLSHQSGLPDYIKYSGRYWSSSEPMYNDEVLHQFATYKFGLRFTPGAKFDYSNSNYAILALIIEKVSGMKYKDFMAKYIFEPLKMDNTFVFDPKDNIPFTIAKSYKSNFTLWKNTHQDGVYGDKGIYTTAQDLFKWDNALYSSNFIQEKTKKEVFEPKRPWKFSKNYGLGWRIKTYPNGNKYAYHTGWWHGYQGIFSRYMQDKFTVVILSNRFISGISNNSQEIYDVASTLLPLTNLNGTPEPHEEEEVEVETIQEMASPVLEGITIAKR